MLTVSACCKDRSEWKGNSRRSTAPPAAVGGSSLQSRREEYRRVFARFTTCRDETGYPLERLQAMAEEVERELRRGEQADLRQAAAQIERIIGQAATFRRRTAACWRYFHLPPPPREPPPRKLRRLRVIRRGSCRRLRAIDRRAALRPPISPRRRSPLCRLGNLRRRNRRILRSLPRSRTFAPSVVCVHVLCRLPASRCIRPSSA